MYSNEAVYNHKSIGGKRGCVLPPHFFLSASPLLPPSLPPPFLVYEPRERVWWLQVSFPPPGALNSNPPNVLAGCWGATSRGRKDTEREGRDMKRKGHGKGRAPLPAPPQKFLVTEYGHLQDVWLLRRWNRHSARLNDKWPVLLVHARQDAMFVEIDYRSGSGSQLFRTCKTALYFRRKVRALYYANALRFSRFFTPVTLMTVFCFEIESYIRDV